MLWKCCIQYASKLGKLSSGHRTGKGQFSFQSQRNAMPKNLQVQSSCSAVSDSLWTCGLQHARLPCSSPTPGAYSNSCPLHQWCYPTISSSGIPFSSHLQSFPVSGIFPVSQFFASGGQSIGVSASASVLPMSTQDWFPLGWTGWISLQSKGLSRVFSNTIIQTTAHLYSSHTLAKQCSKFSKPGFNSMWTMNFQLFKLDLGKAEEPDVKLQISTGSSKKQENSRKISTFFLLTMPKPLTVCITTNCGKFLKRWEYQTTWPASWEICMQVRKQQSELNMEQQTGSKLGKKYIKAVQVHQVLSLCLFNLYAEYITWNASLEEAQAGIKIAGRNINNLRSTDDTILMAESKEELKSHFMNVKGESEKVGLKPNIQKTKIMASGPITSWQIDGETRETVKDFILLGSESL